MLNLFLDLFLLPSLKNEDKKSVNSKLRATGLKCRICETLCNFVSGQQKIVGHKKALKYISGFFKDLQRQIYLGVYLYYRIYPKNLGNTG